MRTKSLVVGIAITACFGAATACGTLFNSSTKTVAMGSTPAGAEVWVNGNRMGETPISLELNNHESHTVVFRLQGYQEVTCELTSSVKAGWVILDILGGLIPVIVDAATGEWKGISQEVCNVNLPVADDASGDATVGAHSSFVQMARQNGWVILEQE